MIEKQYVFVCDNPDCNHLKNNFLLYAGDFSEARALGWVISHDRKKCYCSSCAPLFKSVGRKGTNQSIILLSFPLLEVSDEKSI